METSNIFKNNLENSNLEINTMSRQEEIIEIPQQESVMDLNMTQQKYLASGNIQEEQAPVQVAMRYADRVWNNRRSFSRSDSFRMKQVKDNIQKYATLCNKTFGMYSDFDAMKAGAVDILKELVRVCEEYVGARQSNLDDANSRHGMVNMLLKSARNNLIQIGGMKESDFQGLFKKATQELTFSQLMKQDYKKREIYSEDRKKTAAKAMDDSFRRDHAVLDKQLGLFPKDANLTDALSRYIGLQKEDLPANAAAFEQKKAELKGLCDNINSILTRISTEGAYLESSKERREKANRLLELFKWESKKLEVAKYDSLKKKEICTLDGIWQGEDKMIRSQDATKEMTGTFRFHDTKVEGRENFKVYIKVVDDQGKEKEVRSDEYSKEYDGIIGTNARQNCRNTEKMARLLKVGGLFSKVKDVTLVDYKEQGTEEVTENVTELAGIKEIETLNGKETVREYTVHQEKKSRPTYDSYSKGFYEESEGITLSEALEKARSANINLIYTEDALRDITTIQIMDMICGQVQRTEESLLVKVRKGSKSGENCYLITGVMATNNAYSFGTSKFKNLNQTSKYSSLNKICSNNGSLKFAVYDIELADRIINMDLNDLEKEFPDLKGKRLDALKDRFKKVQAILQIDKNDPKSARSKFEAKMRSTQDPQKQAQYKKEFMSTYQSQFKHIPDSLYVNKVLLKDSGDLEEFDEKAEDKLNSVKLMKQKKETIRQRCQSNIFAMQESGEKISSEFTEILMLVSNYVSLDATTQTGYNLDIAGKRNYVNGKYQNYHIDNAFLQKISGLYSYQALPLLEGWMVTNIRKKINDRKNAITAMSQEQRGEALEKELTELDEFLKLFSDTDGQMEIDPLPEIKDENNEEKFTLLDRENKTIAPKNLMDLKDALLFPHEPCIQDVFQGDLGDCYYISTIAAIVEKDPGFIKKMMRDDGKGNVYVRLYDKGKKIYVKVKKSVPKDDSGNDIYAHGALWVQMLEKAFVISGLHAKNPEALQERKAEFNQLNAEHKRSYKNVESGTETEALKVLTGSGEDAEPTNPDLVFGFYIHYPREDDHRVPSPSGSLYYAGDLDQAAADLKDKLVDLQSHKKVVVFGTRYSFKKSDVPGVQETEDTQQGLSARHAYTFVGVEEHNGVFYARLRNPSGVKTEAFKNQLTGQIGYNDSRKKLGTFCVDMKTLVIYMKDITEGDLEKPNNA